MLETILMTSFRYIFLLIFFVQLSTAQTHIYQHFGVDEGLPSSEVYDIYQDKQGYIWFATDKGLSRYNGYEFENFTTQNGLPDNTILDFHPQMNGQIWCYGYHSKKLFYFEEEFKGFKNYQYNNFLREQLTDPRAVIKSIGLDDTGTLYLGGYGLDGYITITSQGNLSRKYAQKTTRSSVEAQLGFIPEKKLFFSLYHNYKPKDDFQIIDTKNALTSKITVTSINDTLSVLIDLKLGLVPKNGSVNYYETEQYPIGIKRKSNDTFFVGYYNNGAEIRDIYGNVLETYLPNKSVTSFLIDKEGSYWFSTLDDGVFYLKNPTIKVITEQHISSLTKNNENVLYAGFNNGNIANIQKSKINLLHKGFAPDNALVEFNKQTNQLFGYSDHKLFNYSSNDTLRRIYAGKLPEQIKTPLIASVANYYYLIKNNSVKRYFSEYKIQDICYYNDTTLIGTASGLFIQKNDDMVAHRPSNLLEARIDDIDLDKKTNTLYFATQGNGLVISSDKIYNITKNEGLTNDIISEIHIENDSTIWACSNTGLNRIIFRSNYTYKINTITKADGLISNDIDDVEIVNDTIWVATKKGLCYFKKEFLDTKDASQILSLKLKVVKANKMLIDSESKLKHDQNSLDFTLQAISHRNTEKIEYLYRLKEVDTNWAATTNRIISFPSLSPGSYTFQAKADVLNNQSNELITYNFKIRPPFWKSWWFYSICSLLVIGLVYLFFKIRVLTYNMDVFRELIRLAIKRLKRKEQFYMFRANGEDFKIPTREIQYINSQGNYLDIATNKKTYTIRCKIGDFIGTTPDALEYLRVHRSYIIRIDKVTSKGKNWVVINDQKIPVGETYLNQLDKIQF